MPTPLDSIFANLHDAYQASKISLDLEGRVNHPMLAIVSANEDPENKRRVKVNLPSCPGLESTWLYRLVTHPDIDAPIAKIGQSVVVFFQDGIETQGFYSCLQNATNPPIASDEPLIDHTESTKGKRFIEVAKDFVLRVAAKWLVSATDNIELKSDRRITISNLGGASLVLHELGVVILSDVLGNRVILGGMSKGLGYPSDVLFDFVSSDLTLNMNNHTLQINNASDLKIGNKSVATVGALDSRGDSLVDRGY